MASSDAEKASPVVKPTAASPPSSSPARAVDVSLNVPAEGDREKAIASLASLDAAFAEVSTSQTNALEALDGLMRELAACEEAASIPGTLSPALEAARELRARVRRASRKLQRASTRAARVEEGVVEIRRRRERRRRQQGGGGGRGGGESDDGTSSSSSSLSS